MFLAVLGCSLAIACGGLFETDLRLNSLPQGLAGAPVLIAGPSGFPLPDQECGAATILRVAAGVVVVNPSTLDAMVFLHAGSGEYGDPGYVALFGPLVLRFSDGRRRPMVGAVAALGQRSLSGYLFQSVAWTVIFAPFAFNLGGSTYLAVLAAVAVWTVSVFAARAMDKGRYPGPAERLLRRLTFGPR